MLWAFRQLLNPLVYLKVRQGSGLFKSKVAYDWVLPFIGALLTISVLICFEAEPSDGGPSFTDRFSGLLELLIAFFIAALAAVATFERKGLDDPMKGEPAILYYQRADGGAAIIVLSRRQFVCYLFGYLSFISIVFFLGISFYDFVDWSFLSKIPYADQVPSWGRWIGLFIFALFVWQMIVTMLLGVYFLSERLQVMSDGSL